MKAKSTVDPRFASTEFLVEATTFEYMTLWQANDQKEPAAKFRWLQDDFGRMVTVGTICGLPVNISVRWEIINGHRILFWETVSRLVDIQMIEEWFDANCSPRWDHDRRLARTSALNFHLTLEVCRS